MADPLTRHLRELFQRPDAEVYLLQNFEDTVLGIFSTEKALAKGVDYWMKKTPGELLSYRLYDKFDNEEEFDNVEWDFCYIPKDFDLNLIDKSATIPNKDKFGINLISIRP